MQIMKSAIESSLAEKQIVGNQAVYNQYPIVEIFE